MFIYIIINRKFFFRKKNVAESHNERRRICVAKDEILKS